MEKMKTTHLEKKREMAQAKEHPLEFLRLYLITDRSLLTPGGVEEAVQSALGGGLKALQLREKDEDLDDYVTVEWMRPRYRIAAHTFILVNLFVGMTLVIWSFRKRKGPWDTTKDTKSTKEALRETSA